MKKKLIALLQLTIGIGLITFLFLNMKAKGDLSKFADVLNAAASNWPLLVIGFSGFFFSLLLCTWRWKYLLDAQDLHLSFKRILTLYFIGHFFSSFLPGVTSGDFLKAVFAAREAPQKKTAAVSTVFIDRIIGLLGLVILAVILMLTRLPLFLSHTPMKVALVFNLILLAGMTAGLMVMFRKNLLESWTWFQKLEKRTPVGEIIGKAYNAFHVCVNHPGVLWKTTAISMLNHLTFIVAISIIGRGIGVHLSLLDFITAFIIINAVAAIPITPGGIGTREGAAIYILGVFGVAQASAFSLSILTYLSILGWGLIGGIVYLVYAMTTQSRSSIEK